MKFEIPGVQVPLHIQNYKYVGLLVVKLLGVEVVRNGPCNVHAADTLPHSCLPTAVCIIESNV